MKTIEVLVLDAEGFEEYRADFERVKDARQFVKEAALDPSFWDRRAEVAGYAERIHTVQLLVGGEIVTDWFPRFKAAH